ncbi:MAG: glycosyltransferase [Candidatus Eisenbacteria bacterium]
MVTDSTPRGSDLAPSAAPRARLRCLYLATFDPTGSTSGTAARGKLFLRAFSAAFETHVLHMGEKHAAGVDRELVEGLPSIRSVPYSPWDYFFFSRTFHQAAVEMIEARGIDFVFADFEKSGLYARLLQRRFGTPYVYNSHNVEYRRYLDFARTKPTRYPFVPYMYWAEKVACRHALFTVAISQQDAVSFARWLPEDRLTVLPCAFDEQVIHPHYEDVVEPRPVVLLVGNYRNAGNRLGALKVFREILPPVVARHPNVLFRFVGKDLPPEIRHPNAEGLDFVDDLLDQYRRATVVIAPIEIGGGIKIKVIEALAAGRFLVATEKAMEGIPSHGLENLRIVPLERFPDAVADAVAARPPKTTANFDPLRRGFGSRTQLAALTQRIETALEAPAGCDRGAPPGPVG